MGADLSKADKLLATLIAGLLIAGVAVVLVRSADETRPPVALPTATDTAFTETPAATETPTVTETPAATETPTPTVTMTFSGNPPFQQSGTPSPSPSTSGLPHTGSDDGGLLAGAVLLLGMALLTGAALLRAER